MMYQNNELLLTIGIFIVDTIFSSLMAFFSGLWHIGIVEGTEPLALCVHKRFSPLKIRPFGGHPCPVLDNFQSIRGFRFPSLRADFGSQIVSGTNQNLHAQRFPAGLFAF
jgi:hypothetical protein